MAIHQEVASTVNDASMVDRLLLVVSIVAGSYRQIEKEKWWELDLQAENWNKWKVYTGLRVFSLNKRLMELNRIFYKESLNEHE